MHLSPVLKSLQVSASTLFLFFSLFLVLLVSSAVGPQQYLAYLERPMLPSQRSGSAYLPSSQLSSALDAFSQVLALPVARLLFSFLFSSLVIADIRWGKINRERKF